MVGKPALSRKMALSANCYTANWHCQQTGTQQNGTVSKLAHSKLAWRKCWQIGTWQTDTVSRLELSKLTVSRLALDKLAFGKMAPSANWHTENAGRLECSKLALSADRHSANCHIPNLKTWKQNRSHCCGLIEWCEEMTYQKNREKKFEIVRTTTATMYPICRNRSICGIAGQVDMDLVRTQRRLQHCHENVKTTTVPCTIIMKKAVHHTMQHWKANWSY